MTKNTQSPPSSAPGGGHEEQQDVRDDGDLPRDAHAEDAGKSRIPTENLDEDIGD